MVICLTGDNSFALLAELKSLVGDFVAEHGDLAVERVDAEEAEYEWIAEALTSLPFLSAKKLVIIHSPSKNKVFLERVEQLLADIPETTEVILLEPKLDKRSVYYKWLRKNSDFREFNELDTNALAKWLEAEAKAGAGKISASDARFLVERVGANQRLLANELEKLLLHDPAITREAVQELTEETPQSTIFNLLEAAFAGRQKQALQLYSEQRALKVEPPQIIAMLTWQLNVLAIIKTAGDRPSSQIASEAKMSPYVVQKSQGIANRLSLGELKQLISGLVDIDRGLKRTNLDADEALQHYLLSLAA